MSNPDHTCSCSCNKTEPSPRKVYITNKGEYQLSGNYKAHKEAVKAKFGEQTANDIDQATLDRMKEKYAGEFKYSNSSGGYPWTLESINKFVLDDTPYSLDMTASNKNAFIFHISEKVSEGTVPQAKIIINAATIDIAYQDVARFLLRLKGVSNKHQEILDEFCMFG